MTLVSLIEEGINEFEAGQPVTEKHNVTISGKACVITVTIEQAAPAQADLTA